MHFGVCSSQTNAPAAISAGWDYLEDSVQGLLQGLESNWTKPDIKLRIPALNSFLPGKLPIVGPNVSQEQVTLYVTRSMERAKQVGIETVVFGSGVARKVPDGFDRTKAVDQITQFLHLVAPIAQANGVTIVIEPLNTGECNILNSVKEAMTYVHAVKHPNIQCLVDSYHFWRENEPLENLEAAMPWIKHVHVADLEGRVAPGESGKNDYKPFFKVIKQGGYDKLCSVECAGFDFAKHGTTVLQRLKNDWQNA